MGRAHGWEVIRSASPKMWTGTVGRKVSGLHDDRGGDDGVFVTLLASWDWLWSYRPNPRGHGPASRPMEMAVKR